jgi:hypothetical protein
MCHPDPQSIYNYFLSRIWMWVCVSLKLLAPIIVFTSSCFSFWKHIRREISRLEQKKELFLTLFVLNVSMIVSRLLFNVHLMSFMSFQRLSYEASRLQTYIYLLTSISNSVSFFIYVIFSSRLVKLTLFHSNY